MKALARRGASFNLGTLAKPLLEDDTPLRASCPELPNTATADVQDHVEPQQEEVRKEHVAQQENAEDKEVDVGRSGSAPLTAPAETQ